eukprot:766480-Hanusia_phi.AAC.20
MQDFGGPVGELQALRQPHGLARKVRRQHPDDASTRPELDLRLEVDRSWGLLEPGDDGGEHLDVEAEDAERLDHLLCRADLQRGIDEAVELRLEHDEEIVEVQLQD